MGDVLLQTPFISWIKYNYPQAKISYLTSHEFADLIEAHPHIDNIILYKRQKGGEDFKELRQISLKIKNILKPDFIFDLHGTLRAKFLKLLCWNIPSLSVDKRGIERALLIKTKINLLKKTDQHQLRVINDFKFIFNKTFVRDELSLFVDPKSEQAHITSNSLSFSKEVPKLICGKYIVVSPVASFNAKRWPIDRFSRLVQELHSDSDLFDYKIVILGGPDDKYCQDIKSESERIINLQGKTSLKKSIEILGHSALCITNDTGMAHISESFGNPVIAIFGPTDESFGFGPHLKSSHSISLDLWCRPCSGTGSKKCFRKKQYCMEQIEVSDVFDKAKNVLGFL